MYEKVSGLNMLVIVVSICLARKHSPSACGGPIFTCTLDPFLSSNYDL